jgi:hypothetical protein
MGGLLPDSEASFPGGDGDFAESFCSAVQHQCHVPVCVATQRHIRV